MPPAPMPADPAHAASNRRDDRRLWLGYAGMALLCWTLYAVAGMEWLSGPLRGFEAVYEATWNVVPPALIGVATLPWLRALQRRSAPAGAARFAAHAFGAFAFAALWQAVDAALAVSFFGADHAVATFEQRVLWRSAWAVFVYAVLVVGFSGALHARRAHRAALAAAEAEAALVRAELAAIAGKLNPHFLFNTLNSIVLLTRQDPAAAERALLRFSRMMRHLLDANRDAADRVPLQDELDFVRDYLELESLRLGPRLHVEWLVDSGIGEEAVPPLTLQPLVENAVVHGIAPRIGPGTVRVECRRVAETGGLVLRVSDDGAGCAWPPPEKRGGRSGVGLAALKRRFELEYGGRARFDVRSAPGAGFAVEIATPAAAA